MTISVHLFKQMRSSVLQHQIAWFVLKCPCQTNSELELKYRLGADCCSMRAEISPFWVNGIATEKKENSVLSGLLLCYSPILSATLATGCVLRCLEET